MTRKTYEKQFRSLRNQVRKTTGAHLKDARITTRFPFTLPSGEVVNSYRRAWEVALSIVDCFPSASHN